MTAATSDAELDALARDLPHAQPAAASLEDVRTALLASAGRIAPLPARLISSRLRLAVIALPIAAAAAIALWVIAAPNAIRRPLPSHALLVSADQTEMARISSPPDEIVYLRSGSLTADVPEVGNRQRFRVITTDAEIEVQSAKFVVAVDRRGGTSVAVSRGAVEIRPWSSEDVVLGTGDHWSSAVTEAEDALPPLPEPAPQPQEAVSPAAAPPATPRHRASTKGTPKQPASSGVSASPAPEPAEVTTPALVEPPTPDTISAPGEAEFRAGWDALRRRDPSAAAASFASSRRAARRGAVAEDASFWEGVALARAARSSDAIAALRRFIASHGKSARAGEASARLGWLLLDTGDLDAATRAFEASVNDRVPSVRRSARSGLDKIALLRKR